MPARKYKRALILLPHAGQIAPSTCIAAAFCRNDSTL